MMRSFALFCILGCGLLVDADNAFDARASNAASTTLNEGTPADNLRRNLQYTWSLAKVVTLGDSYASGLGIHRYAWEYDQLRGGSSSIDSQTYRFNPNGGYCYREFNTVPGGRLARALGQEHIQMGCSAAQIDQIEEQFDYVNQMYPLEEYMGWDGSTIIVFAGGNDIRSRGGDGWSGVITDCILENGDRTDCDDFLSNRLSNVDRVETDLLLFYNQLANRAPNARIRIFGYPKLMLPDPISGCTVLGISLEEANWIDSRVELLNERIAFSVFRTQQAFPDVDIEFVDVGDYVTRGSCGQLQKEINGLVLLFGIIPTPASFHPSQAGQDAFYEALLDSLSS